MTADSSPILTRNPVRHRWQAKEWKRTSGRQYTRDPARLRGSKPRQLSWFPMTYSDVIRLIKRGDTVEVRHALDGGLDPNLSNEIGTTILMLAAMEGRTPIVGLLVDYGAQLDRINDMRDSALTLAAWFAHPKVVKLLLERGASLDHIRKSGSFDSFLQWVETYCGMATEQLTQLRNA